MTARPRVITCQGNSSAARLAVEVARALEATGAAGPVVELSDANGDAAAANPAIAIDGCGSACGSRLAVARGIELVTAVSLAELDVESDDADAADPRALAARVATRLEGHTASPAPTRPRRHGAPSPTAGMQAHTVDDYLLAIAGLTSPIVECGAVVTDAPTLASHVSSALGVSRASAGEMLHKMESDGLVRRGRRKELLLTSSGRARADASLRRQRLLEVFVTGYLGYDLSESWDRARDLGGSFDDDAISRLEERLGFPERCPHGCPLDGSRARDESRHLRTLGSLAVADRAHVAWLPESGPALPVLLQEGIRPGVELTIGRVTAAGDLRIDVDGRAVTLDPQAAGAVLVRPGRSRV